MLFRRGPVASRAKERKTKREKNNKLVHILVAMFLGVFVSVFALNSLAKGMFNGIPTSVTRPDWYTRMGG